MKSRILYGPQGSGKTRKAEKIAKQYGLKITIDGYDGTYPVNKNNFLYITNDEKVANDSSLFVISIGKL